MGVESVDRAHGKIEALYTVFFFFFFGLRSSGYLESKITEAIIWGESWGHLFVRLR